ncbi:uncharacterized protein [Ptychodera flava]|uniref:uncharacterized protein n=1 Tax=Ptychodera flava TaxID=63121 RepID=UPI003969C944
MVRDNLTEVFGLRSPEQQPVSRCSSSQPPLDPSPVSKPDLPDIRHTQHGCLSKLPYSALRLLVPTLVVNTVNRMQPLWGKPDMSPPWWPESVPYCNPSKRPREIEGSWTEMLRLVAEHCYDFYNMQDFTGNTSSPVAAQPNSDNSPQQSHLSSSPQQTALQLIQCYDSTLNQTDPDSLPLYETTLNQNDLDLLDFHSTPQTPSDVRNTLPSIDISYDTSIDTNASLLQASNQLQALQVQPSAHLNIQPHHTEREPTPATLPTEPPTLHTEESPVTTHAETDDTLPHLDADSVQPTPESSQPPPSQQPPQQHTSVLRRSRRDCRKTAKGMGYADWLGNRR